MTHQNSWLPDCSVSNMTPTFTRKECVNFFFFGVGGAFNLYDHAQLFDNATDLNICDRGCGWIKKLPSSNLLRRTHEGASWGWANLKSKSLHSILRVGSCLRACGSNFWDDKHLPHTTTTANLCPWATQKPPFPYTPPSLPTCKSVPVLALHIPS